MAMVQVVDGRVLEVVALLARSASVVDAGRVVREMRNLRHVLRRSFGLWKDVPALGGSDVLYLSSSDGQLKIVILESANLDELKKGRPAHTPDKSVLIAWTPDPVWLADKLMDCGGDSEKIGRLIDEASKRPEKAGPRPTHKMHEHKFRNDT